MRYANMQTIVLYVYAIWECGYAGYEYDMWYDDMRHTIYKYAIYEYIQSGNVQYIMVYNMRYTVCKYIYIYMTMRYIIYEYTIYGHTNIQIHIWKYQKN